MEALLRARYSPQNIDKTLITPDVTDAIIDSVKQKQDQEAAEKKAAFDRQNKISLRGGSGSGSRDDKATKDLDEIRREQKKLLAAVTAGDVMCEPLVESRSSFQEFTILALYDQLTALTKKSPSGRQPRFAMTVLSKETETGSGNVPDDLLLEGERSGLRAVQKVYWKPVEDMPRIPVGVICKIENGQPSIYAKNVAKDDMNSQYYIRRAQFVVYLEKEKTGALTRKTVFDVAIDAALGTDEIKWFRLTQPSDWLLLNVNLPDEQPMVFSDLKSQVEYMNDKINQLQEDHLRLQASLKTKTEQYQRELKEWVVSRLGEHNFIGSLGKLADCLISSFDPTTGKWSDAAYLKCLEEVTKTNDFYQSLLKIREQRKDTENQDGGEWIEKLNFVPQKYVTETFELVRDSAGKIKVEPVQEPEVTTSASILRS